MQRKMYMEATFSSTFSQLLGLALIKKMLHEPLIYSSTFQISGATRYENMHEELPVPIKFLYGFSKTEGKSLKSLWAYTYNFATTVLPRNLQGHRPKPISLLEAP